MAPTPEPPVAQIAHSSPRRLRLRIEARRGSLPYFEHVTKVLAAGRNVESVQANARTGSVLIVHSGEPDAICKAGEQGGLFLMESEDRQAPRIADRLKADVQEINSWFSRSSSGELDLGTLMMLGLLGLSGVQILRGQLLAPAVTLAFYGASMLYATTTTARGR